MANSWHYRVQGMEFGPVSSEVLKSLADKGELSPTDQLRPEGSDAWVDASRVQGLFPVSGKPEKTATEQALPVAKPLEEPDSFDQVDSPNEPPPLPDRISGSAEDFQVSTGPPPKAPPKTADEAAEAIESARRKRRRNRRVTVVLLSVATVGGIVGGGIWLSSIEVGEPTAKAPSDDSRVEETSPSMPEAEMVWVPAFEQSATQGDITVRVAVAELGKPRLISADASYVAQPADEFLMLQVSLSNSSPTKKISYSGWGQRTVHSRDVLLQDDLGNAYAIKVFRMPIENQLQDASVYPSDTIHDLLVFEPPVEQATSLRLTLPAAVFGETGLIGFEIPTDRILQAESADVPAESPDGLVNPDEPSDETPLVEEMDDAEPASPDFPLLDDPTSATEVPAEAEDMTTPDEPTDTPSLPDPVSPSGSLDDVKREFGDVFGDDS